MAASEVSLLVQELNKLTKPMLIDMIVHKKVPGTIKCGELLKNCINGKGMPIKATNNTESEVFHDSHDYNDKCLNTKCVLNCMELTSSKQEITTLNQLTYRLEKRIGDQEEIIKLLKTTSVLHSEIGTEPSSDRINDQESAKVEQRISSNKTAETSKVEQKKVISKIQKPNTNGKEKGQHKNIDTQTKSVTQSQKITAGQVKNGIEKALNNIGKSTEVVYKHHSYKKPIIGSNNNNNVLIKTVPKMGHLHVYRCDSDTSCENLLQFLKETAPQISFKCAILKQNESSTSFKVEFPMQHVQEVYEPNIWPSGAAVRRFRFPRRENFHQQASEINLQSATEMSTRIASSTKSVQ